MNNTRLLAALLRHLTSLLPTARAALRLNLALLVLALAQSPNLCERPRRLRRAR